MYFYISFFLVSMAQTFGIGASDNPVVVLLTLISIIPFVLKIINTKFTKHELIITAFLTLYAIISVFTSKNSLMLINIFCIIGIKNVDIKKFIKCLFVYRLIGFLAVIILTNLGFLPNREIYLFKNGANTYIIRESLGFYHPNLLALYFFVLVAMFIYGYFEKIKYYHFLILLIPTIIIYNICYSRTGLVCTLLLIFISMFVKYAKNMSRIILNKFTIWIPILLAIFMVAFTVFYFDNPLFSKINSLLSGRLYLSHSYIENYGITLFGVPLQNSYIINGEVSIIDSGFVFLLLNYGIVGFSLALISIYKCCQYFLKDKNTICFAILLVFSCYCITEKTILIFLLNFPLLYLSQLLFKKENKVQ